MKERVLKILALLICLCLAFSTACTNKKPSSSKESISGSETTGESEKESVSGNETTGESEKESVSSSESTSESIYGVFDPLVLIRDAINHVNYGWKGGIMTVIGFSNGISSAIIKETMAGDPVEKIDDEAFSSCYTLTDIYIPKTVTDIGHGVFTGCRSLVSIKVSEDNPNYKSIDGNLYSKDGKVLIQYALGKTEREFTIPSGVTHIGDNAFSGSNHLKKIVLNDEITQIGSKAFYGCEISSIDIPASVTNIESQAFRMCAELASITVNENNANYKSIDGNLYSKDGTALIQYASGKVETALTIPSTVKTIGDYACSSSYDLTKVSIEYGVTSIGDFAFSNCWELSIVVIPESVTSIGEYAFANCWELRVADIPDSVTKIKVGTFKSCSLKSVVIGKGVKIIAREAFHACNELESVCYKGTESEWEEVLGGKGNENFTSAITYFYSKTEPTEEGNYWHYGNNGIIKIWCKNCY